MSEIILECGSGNTCQNDPAIVRQMIDAVDAIDTQKHDVVFKWQIFIEAPPNVRLTHNTFRYAFDYAAAKGYKTTASVFDKLSLNYLLMYDPCFVKIACRPELYWLVGEVPRKIPVYVSYNDDQIYNLPWGTGSGAWLCCVPKYPALLKEYEESEILDYYDMQAGTSDHTVGLELWNTYHPAIWEKHYVLEHDDNNPDAGPFAVTPEDLKEIL